jgi:hypothetical protein
VSDRRTLLRAGAGGALGLALGRPVPAAAQAPDLSADVRALRALVDHERRVQATYKLAASATALGQPIRDLAARLADIEQQHVDVLRGYMSERGAPVAAVPLPLSAIAGLASALRSDSAFLPFAIAIENTALVAQIASLDQFSDDALVERIGLLIATEGSHLSELRVRAGVPDLPLAFAGPAGA